MANYETLKAAIADVIKTNGNNAITGALMQQSLLSMIDSLGVGYQFAGLATPTTNPGTPDQKVFYIAAYGGEYTNFGAITVPDKLSLLVYASSWSVISVNVPLKNGPFDNLVNQDGGSVGKAINSNGQIFDASAGYHVFYLNLAAGWYWAKFYYAGSQTIFWKYTDNTYSSPERLIIGGVQNVDEIVYLDAGYYALGINLGSTNEFVFADVSCIYNIFNNQIGEQINNIETPFSNIALPIVSGKYINDSGVISDASASYKLGKFQITKGCKIYIGDNLYNSHPVLCEYSDSGYTILKRIIISYAEYISRYVNVEPGYYAICSYDTDLRVVAFNEIGNDLVVSVAQPLGNIGGLQDFSGFLNGAWTRVDDNTFENNPANVGIAYRAPFPTELYGDDFIMKCVFTPLATDASGNFMVSLAKTPVGSGGGGTAVMIGKDANGTFMSLGKIMSESYTPAERVSLSGLRVAVNRPLSVVLEKHTDTRVWFSATVTDDAGNVAEISRVTDWDDNMNILGGLALGYCMLYADAGKWRAQNYSYGYRKDINDIKLVIMGHSFVDGKNSTVFEQDKRFSSLLANDVGIDNSCIFGLGGGGVGMIDGLKIQLEWVKTCRYAILCFGTNDPDTAATCNAYAAFNEWMIGQKIIPIWLTVTPHRDQGQIHPVFNAYIKQNFKYIDVEQIFLNTNGTVNTALFSDEVHPTIEGYNRMYKVIKSQGAQIFEI